MRIWKIGLITLLCVAATTAALAQPTPLFPQSELRRGHEGWVLVTCSLADDGSVTNLHVANSSGNDAFEDAAVEAVRDWQINPPDQMQSSVLVNFIFEDKQPVLSKRFVSRNAKVHLRIDRGQFDEAQALIDEFRTRRPMNPFEFAYSFIAEARIAEGHGDKAGQLRMFRQAMLSNGHWVADDTYADLLYATTILALQQRELASAVRDYELLLQLESSREIPGEVVKTILAAKQYLAEHDGISSPHMAANYVVDVSEKRPHDSEGYDAHTGAGAGWGLSSDKGDTPPPNN